MDRIKEVLRKKDIRQVLLSEKLGKSSNMLNDYCNNKRQPSLEILYQIATILSVSPKGLLKENTNEH
jgi:putative transcriptional regulator